MRTRGWLIIGLALAAALLLIGRAVTALAVDHAWFAAMGVSALFWAQFLDTLLLQGGAWVLGSVFAVVNLHAVRRTIVAVTVPSRVANLQVTAMISGQRLMAVTVVLGTLVGAALAVPLSNWADVALVRHGLAFREIEGIFGRDLGFYVYWLPLEETLYLWALVSVVANTALVVVLYALTRSLRMEGRRVAASTHVRRHLSVLGALVLLLLAWSYRLDGFDLLRQGSGADGTFLKVDHRVTLQLDTVLAFGSAIAALVVLRSGWVGHLRTAFLTLTVILVSAIGLRQALPAVISRTSLLGDPSRRDLDYLATRALFSRRAFDVEGIRPRSDDRRARVPRRLSAADLPTRVSLWDATALMGALTPASATSTGARDSQQSSEAARAEDTGGGAGARSGLDAVSVGWSVMGEHVTAVVARPTGAERDGWVVSAVDVSRPTMRDSVLAFEPAGDAPAGDEPMVGPGIRGTRLLADRRYRNIPGVSLRSWRARVAHAWALRDLSLLSAVSGAVEPILISHRDVRARVARLAPIFVQSTEVLPLVHDARLYWTVQLYSASDRYPLSQRWQIGGGIYSYFRLAATAVVESATGRVALVLAARPDAPTRTWRVVAPSLFSAAGDLPAGVLAQLPVPTEGAVAQIKTFARYGSRFAGSVTRQLPDSALVGGTPAPHALIDNADGYVGWSLPLLDAGDQIDGVVTATGGPARQTWWDSTASPRLRWRTVTGRLQSALDSTRSAAQADTANRSQSGTGLRVGRVSTVMTTRGPLLIQSLLIPSLRPDRGPGNREIGRVATSDGTRIADGTTLADALGQMGDIPIPPVSPLGAAPLQPDPFSARRWYRSMRDALTRGDWVKFGAAFDSLGRVLERPPQ
ncbi:MAG: UPF0182 family protein [Gemmatimonadota bacterium]|nr:UPF0182 family protein [Gemmatimonadota bacterium]